MNKTNETKDRFGRTVKVGDPIRMVFIVWPGISELPEEEIDDLKAMIGEVFEVEEIDELGRAAVSRSWSRPNGRFESHTLWLTSAEMESIISP